ncbi:MULTISPECIES: hypothetical protein [unclassified Bradyrhizobium]|uniref:hypothetical protein n=1 Tax=unclassified Bradyrhizobium TaxID=2631580 RepID=UPI0003FD80DF|nr:MULTISPECIES: hypothetical protein [unclassified Bradyrhizobium]MCP3466636.1 hypothetical protein [Bradyrhizobium sp. CCGUVB23]
MSDIDPTDHALATIASILEHPEAPPETEKFASVDEDLVVDEQPLVPQHPADADGYSKLGPGPMAALRFKWTVQRGDEGLYYVHETIGEYSTPVVSGPMSGEAAVQFVDERESEAHRRFEVLRDEIANRSSVSDIVRKGEV